MESLGPSGNAMIMAGCHLDLYNDWQTVKLRLGVCAGLCAIVIQRGPKSCLQSVGLEITFKSVIANIFIPLARIIEM
jgi:hypothetical protein